MKYCPRPFVTMVMLLICLAAPVVTQAADRLVFLKGSNILQSSLDAMMALPGGGIISGADIYMGFAQIPFAEEDVLVHNLDDNSFSVYRDSAYFRSGVLENATPFELFVHLPTTQLPVSLFEYESTYGETILDNLLSLPGTVIFYDLVLYAVPGPGGGDTTPPILHLPGNITADAMSDLGAEVVFSVSATDNVDPDSVISCTPASGSLFPVGETTVNCSATDNSNNTAQGSFTVTVNPFSVLPDFDDDGIPDEEDNCILIPNGPLEQDAGGNSQYDTDGDGYGNVCDCDLNQDNFCGGPDFTLFIGCFNAVAGFDAICEAADMNGDGFVGGPDFTLFIGGFNQAPGPSAYWP